MKFHVLAAFAALLIAAPASAQNPAKPKIPRFADYPVQVYKGPLPEKPLKFPPDTSEEFELKLGDSYSPDFAKVDAAGNYVRILWSCGSSCVSSGFVDAKTGQVIYSPFTVSGWRRVYDDFASVDTRAGSKLVIYSGARNEEGVVGRHYYLLDNGEFKHLLTVDTRGNFTVKPK